MSGINHVAGGIVLTGILASFKDINIFSDVRQVMLTIFFSLLPDIDCPNSIIGRLFFPISRYLNKRYGHRTITHSLLVYLLLGVVLAVLERFLFESSVSTLIYFVAYFSHLLFDMMTLSGVPLFYPFKRNPFVMPGNPNLRLKSGDVRAEMVVFLFFVGTALSCNGLFKDGFWTTYNQSFGSIKHLKREFSRSQDLLAVRYNYSKGGNSYSGNGYVIGTSSKGVFVYDGKEIVCLNNGNSFKELSYKHTAQRFNMREDSFQSLSTEQLQQKMDQKVIVRLNLHSSVPFKFQGHQSFREYDEARYVVDPILVFDVQGDLGTKKLDSALKKLKSDKLLLEKERDWIEGRLSNMDDYNREVSTQRLKKVRESLEKLEDKIARNDQLRQLNEVSVNNPIKLDGKLWYIDLQGMPTL